MDVTGRNHQNGPSDVPIQQRLFPQRASLDDKEIGPVPRRAHTLTISPDGILYLYGGLKDNHDNPLENPVLAELWRYDTKKREGWERLNAIMGTQGSTSAFYNNNLIFIGGMNARFYNSSLAFAQIYPIQTGIWEAHHPSVQCDSHAMVQNGKQLFIFGGQDMGFVNHRLWLCDLETKELRLLIDDPHGPNARCWHGIAVSDTEIFVFGGQSFRGAEDLIVAWGFTVSSRKWTAYWSHPDPQYGYPEARRLHTVERIDDCAFIIGGIGTVNQMFNDIWMFDMVAKAWKRLSISLKRPVFGHASCMSKEGVLYVFGGVIGLGEPYMLSRALYMIDLKPYTLQRPTGLPRARELDLKNTILDLQIQQTRNLLQKK